MWFLVGYVVTHVGGQIVSSTLLEAKDGVTINTLAHWETIVIREAYKSAFNHVTVRVLSFQEVKM